MMQAESSCRCPSAAFAVSNTSTSVAKSSMLLKRLLIVFWLAIAPTSAIQAADDGLVGYWKLQGDCRDHSGKQNHGQNHGVGLSDGRFNGQDAYIEVAPTESLRITDKDFSIILEVNTE